MASRAQEVFEHAVELAGAEREAYLRGTCGYDQTLRTDVDRLFRAYERGADFLGTPTAAHPEHPPTAATTIGAPIREGPGTRIGPYKILQLIGEGGFGSVFMAEQEKPVARKVALKIIKLGMDTKAVIARFEAERQALALMDHPNIAKVLDAGATETGRPYFVMELCKGEAIIEYCDRNNLGIEERLELFAQVCTAVQHAHTKGIIHRDLKPSNILVSTQDGKPHAKVIDFGIAKATAGKLTEKTLFTEHRALIGTPEYMSPEQAEGSLDIDTRTDVYSLGVLLYELLTGTTPFTSNELRSAAYAEIQRIIREVEPPKPSTRLSQNADTIASIAARRHTEPKKLGTLVRGELDWIVMKALDKDRQRRYESASQLAADVKRHMSGEAVAAAPPSAAYRLRKFVRRNKGPVAAAAAISAVVILAGTTVWGFALQTQRQAAIAKANAEEARKNADEAKKQAQLAVDAAAFVECAKYNPDDHSVTIPRALTSEAARHLSRLPGVEKVQVVFYTKNDDDETLRLLADPATGLDALTTLDLSRTAITDEGVKELARPDSGLKALTTLDLRGTKVTDAGLKELARPDSGLKALTSLDLDYTAITGTDLEELARPDTGLRALTTLGLRGTKVADAGLKELARSDSGLKALTRLDLAYTAITDAGLREIARPDTGLKAMIELLLGGTKVTDAGLKELARPDSGLKALTELFLWETQVTDAGLKELARSDSGLRTLTWLELSDTTITDAGLKELARPDSGLRALTTLNLCHTAITDEGLKELARPDSGLRALTWLDLTDTKVTDAGLKELARPDSGLRTLTRLDLYHTAITDEGLKELARPDSGLKALTSLDLRGTQVTDAGLKELARPDSGLRALTSLDLFDTQVTETGIAALKERFPGIKIEHYPN